MTWNEKQPHGVLSNMWQCQEQKLRGAAKPGLQSDYSEWQNPNTRLRFSIPKPCVSSAVPLAPCRVPPKSTTTTEELNSACQVRLESSIIRNKLKKISWGDTWCCPCVIKRSHHMVLQAEETRVMRRQGHEQKRQYPEQTTQNPSVCCLLESTWEIAFCNVSFSCFLPSKWSFSSRIPAAGRAAPSPLCPGCSFWPLLLPDVQGQVKWWLIHSLVHLPSSLRLFPSKDLSFIPRTLPLHSFIHRFLARLNEAPQNPAVTSSALQRCPVPGEGKKKNCLPFVSKYFGPVLWEACSFLRNEKERSLIPCSAPRWGRCFGLSDLVTAFLCLLLRAPLHLRGTLSHAQPSRRLNRA